MAKIDQAYEHLKGDILATRLAPGAPLIIARLIERTGLGWTPLREALSRLEAENLVVSEPNKGYRVAPVSAASVQDLQIARQSVEETLLLRSLEQGDADWEAGLVAAHHGLARAPVPASTLPACDTELWEHRHDMFHKALLSAGDCATLARFQAQVSVQLRRHHRHMLGEAVLQRKLDPIRRRDFDALVMRTLGLDHHTALMDAALARDHDAARALFRQHVGFSIAVYAFLWPGDTEPG